MSSVMAPLGFLVNRVRGQNIRKRSGHEWTVAARLHKMREEGCYITQASEAGGVVGLKDQCPWPSRVTNSHSHIQMLVFKCPTCPIPLLPLHLCPSMYILLVFQFLLTSPLQGFSRLVIPIHNNLFSLLNSQNFIKERYLFLFTLTFPLKYL